MFLQENSGIYGSPLKASSAVRLTPLLFIRSARDLGFNDREADVSLICTLSVGRDTCQNVFMVGAAVRLEYSF